MEIAPDASRRTVRAPEWLNAVPAGTVERDRFRGFLFTNERDYPDVRESLVASAASRDGKFVVYAKDSGTAQTVAEEASRVWPKLSQAWLGKEPPRLDTPIHICAATGDNLRLGGGNGMHYHDATWCNGLILTGPLADVLVNTLPHELTHVLIGSHRNQATRAWADEGMAMQGEHPMQQSKFQRGIEDMLARGTTLSPEQLFGLNSSAENPRAVYFQGFSYTQYLIARGEQIEQRETDGRMLSGRQRFLGFVDRAFGGDSSPEKIGSALSEMYGFNSTMDFDASWRSWMRNGGQMKADSLMENIDASTGSSRTYDPRVRTGVQDLTLPPRP